jgi:hypothetical protein
MYQIAHKATTLAKVPRGGWTGIKEKRPQDQARHTVRARRGGEQHCAQMQEFIREKLGDSQC